MTEPVLIINGNDEVPLDRGLITIGRASDNTIAFAEDSNVSRYHAEIEKRGEGEFWLFDLNSSNGTTLNGERVTVEKPLYDGDVITIGGSQNLEVVLSARERATGQEEKAGEQEPVPDETDDSEPEDEPVETGEPAKQKVSMLFILVGLAIGLAFISLTVVGVIYLTSGGGILAGSCDARASIAKPQNGDILNQATAIEIDLQDNSGCVKQVIYTIDGQEVASADAPPFAGSIDPSRFPGLSDGLDHKLKVVLVDTEGNRIEQPAEIALNFDTLATETPSPTPGQEQVPGGPGPEQPPQSTQISLTDTKSMTERVIPLFSGNAEYVTGNPGFLDAVNRLTAEYAEPGYFERARKYRDVINTEFIQERGLDAPLAYILAMSRTKFVPTNDQKGAGLWKMDNNLVLEYRYNGLCGSETIASPGQSCAAIASSSYLKDVILKVFGGNAGDIIFVVAAFGMSPLEAAEWKQSLPEDRKDFWRVLGREPQKQDQVARFFAAGIVAENPGRFGLKDDRPLSELYGNQAGQQTSSAK